MKEVELINSTEYSELINSTEYSEFQQRVKLKLNDTSIEIIDKQYSHSMVYIGHGYKVSYSLLIIFKKITTYANSNPNQNFDRTPRG